jgi:hypothetical protein
VSEQVAVAAIVLRVADDDAMLMVGALADPLVLLVFGVIVAGTSKARVVDDFGRPPSGTSYLTPFGLARTMSLPRDVIEWAAERLVRVGLLEVLTDEQRGYDSWRVNEAAIAAASA